ncbi:TPA: hypothetical protein ACGX4U_002741 [Enterococcus faecalis]
MKRSFWFDGCISIFMIMTAIYGWQQHQKYKLFYQEIQERYKEPILILDQPADIGLALFLFAACVLFLLVLIHLSDRFDQQQARKQVSKNEKKK